MNIKKKLISWGIVLSVGAILGVGLGIVGYHYSQPHRVLVLQKALIKSVVDIEFPSNFKELSTNVIEHSINQKQCAQTIVNELNDIRDALKGDENSSNSASYTTTGTFSTKTPAGVVAMYTEVLLEDCK